MQDRSFTFILKTPPASFLIRKAAGIPKGSGAPNTQKVGSLTTAQLKVRLMTFCRRVHSAASAATRHYVVLSIMVSLLVA